MKKPSLPPTDDSHFQDFTSEMLLDKKQIKKILIRCPTWVGDIVMATPVIECLHHNFPDARISCLVKTYASGILENSPGLDEIIPFNDKNYTGFMNLTKKIREIQPDLFILLPNSFRSILSAWLGKSKRIYGYKRNLRSFLLTDGPIPEKDKNGKIIPIPMKDYYLDICRHLELEIFKNSAPRLFFSKSIQKKGMELLRKYDIQDSDFVIGINPGASFGSSKCWPPEYFAKTAELFQKHQNAKILLLASPSEKEITDKIIEISNAEIINTQPDQIDLGILKPLIKRCNLLITNDTGPRHYAVAFEIPQIVIMGPTDPEYTASDLDKTIILRQDLKCSPCHKKTCPLNHECMTMISPEMVLDAGNEILKRYSN